MEKVRVLRKWVIREVKLSIKVRTIMVSNTVLPLTNSTLISNTLSSNLFLEYPLISITILSSLTLSIHRVNKGLSTIHFIQLIRMWIMHMMNTRPEIKSKTLFHTLPTTPSNTLASTTSKLRMIKSSKWPEDLSELEDQT
jgi:hypothetical protein